MSPDASNFLASLLFTQPEDSGLPSHSVDDFSPEFIAGAESFIAGFIAYLGERHPRLHECRDLMERSFGGNVYFTLSGHGCGFWDDSEPEGRELAEALYTYSGNRYRFENIDLMLNADGKLDLSYVPSAIAQYRAKLFAV